MPFLDAPSPLLSETTLIMDGPLLNLQTNSIRFQFDLEQIIWFMAIPLVKLFFRFIKNHRYRPGNLVMLLNLHFTFIKGESAGELF